MQAFVNAMTMNHHFKLKRHDRDHLHCNRTHYQPHSGHLLKYLSWLFPASDIEKCQDGEQFETPHQHVDRQGQLGQCGEVAVIAQ